MNCNITSILKKFLLIEKSTLQVTTSMLCSEQLFTHLELNLFPTFL